MPGTLPPGGEGEFVDEVPGSYLGEVASAAWIWPWAVLNFGLVLSLGLGASRTGLSRESEWFPAARLLWILLLASSALPGLLGGGIALSPYTRPGSRRGWIALAFATLSLVAWWWLRAPFLPPEP